MLRRRAAIAAVMLAAAVTLWNGLAIWREPGPGDPAPSAYSAMPYGFRALYDIAEALGADVSRSMDPPALLFRGERRIVLLEPDLTLLEREKGALTWMADWVRAGGELVVVAADMALDEPIWSRTPGAGRRSAADEAGDTAPTASGGEPEEESGDGEARDVMAIMARSDFLRNFGLEGLTIAGDAYATVDEEDVYSPFEDDMFTRSYLNRADTRRAVTFRSGRFVELAGDVEALYLPERDTSRFEGSPVSAASGALRIDMGGEAGEVPIALHYAIGEGELTLVCQPSLFTNIAVGEGENAVAAARIVLGGGDLPVVFDEYYKGRSVAGNAFALFGLYPYGAVLGASLAALAITAWAGAGRLGPAMPDPPVPRRSQVEYVRAMGMLFRRGGHTRFALELCRRGVLGDIERAMRLPHGAPPQAVLMRLARKDPSKAVRLEDTLRAVDGALKAPEQPTPGQTLSLMERLEACRPKQPERPTPPAASQTSTTGR